MAEKQIPEFVIAGHPNEGKSSVLSTLTEDDSVRISPYPGETRMCRSFPVVVDGAEIIRFVDTPGFQNPLRSLKWMQKYSGPSKDIVKAFIDEHGHDPAFKDDCELLAPIHRAHGVIFVVDGSRPIRRADKAEMEILRIIGRPRMAVINCKKDQEQFIKSWQEEFRKHFNTIRIFNSCLATFRNRIDLLQSLKAIDQDLSTLLDSVIESLLADWKARRQISAETIVSMLWDILSYTRQTRLSSANKKEEGRLRERLLGDYRTFAKERERKAHDTIRKVYKHNILDATLPGQSIVQEDLFSKRTWEFLGLSKRQLIVAGALGGAITGAVLDLGHGGLSMGIFSLSGGIVGGLGAAYGGKELLSGKKILGISLDKETLRVGPVSNIQLLYILLDRAFIYFEHVTNWAHGRRDYENASKELLKRQKMGLTSSWGREHQKVCQAFFNRVTNPDADSQDLSPELAFTLLVEDTLKQICG